MLAEKGQGTEPCRGGEVGDGLRAGLQSHEALRICHRYSNCLIHQPSRHLIFKRTGRPGLSSTAS